MIRIQLRSRSRVWRRVGVIFGGSLLLATVAMASLYWVDRYFPLFGLWRAILPTLESPIQPRIEPSGAGVVRADRHWVKEAHQDVGWRPLEAIALRSTALGAVAQKSAVGPTPARLESSTVHIDSLAIQTRGAASRRFVRSTACKRALRLLSSVPAQLRIYSLIATGDGKYTIEGAGTTTPLDGVLEILRVSLGVNSDISLTLRYNKTHRVGSNGRFLFDGSFRELQNRDLASLSNKAAVTAMSKWSSQGRAQGLDSLISQDPIDVVLGEELILRRLKLWARGSLIQMHGFLDDMAAAESLSVRQIVAIPRYVGSECSDRASFFTVVEMLVRVE